jgi:MFS family permease
LIRSRTFTAASVLMFLGMVALLGTILLIPLYYQQVHGFTPLHAGLLMAPYGIGSALALTVAGRLTDRFGVRPVAVTGSVLLVGVLLVLTQIAATTGPAVLIPLITLGGAGFGAILVPAQAGIFGRLPSESIPHATTAVRVFQQVGGSFGVAVLAVSLQRNAAGAGSTAELAQAFGTTFWWAAGAAALTLIPVLLLRDRRRVLEPVPGHAAAPRDRQDSLSSRPRGSGR